jgi:hypothetical protein
MVLAHASNCRGRDCSLSFSNFLQEISGLKDYMLEIISIPSKEPLTLLHWAGDESMEYKMQEDRALRIFHMLKERKELALVAYFLAENDFVPKKGADAATKQKITYDGITDEDKLHMYTMPDGDKSTATHSILLIGSYLETETDTVYFLLQNWWGQKYFVQVTTECQIVSVREGFHAAVQESFECIDTPFAEGFSPMEGWFEAQGYCSTSRPSYSVHW